MSKIKIQNTSQFIIMKTQEVTNTLNRYWNTIIFYRASPEKYRNQRPHRCI